MHRTNAYPSVGHLPPTNTSQTPNVSTSSVGYGGGYTLPPTAAYFPVGTYSTLQAPSGPQQTTIIEMQHDGTAMTQPNTPDLLMHRRQVNKYTEYLINPGWIFIKVKSLVQSILSSTPYF